LGQVYSIVPFSKTASSGIIQEEAVNNFKGQHLVDLVGVVPVTPQMTVDDGFQTVPLNIGPAET
jgi:hypothetical protein